jgi:hypothetical protein
LFAEAKLGEIRAPIPYLQLDAVFRQPIAFIQLWGGERKESFSQSTGGELRAAAFPALIASSCDLTGPVKS